MRSIWTSKTPTAVALRRWLRLVELQTRDLQQLGAWSAERPGPLARPTAGAIAHPPVLVGRAGEWRALQTAWAADRTVLLSGDAGMGKTRLLEDFSRAQAVPLVRAHAGDERVPYAVLSRLLRVVAQATLDNGHEVGAALRPFVLRELARVLPELGAASGEPLSEVRFRQAVCDALRLHVSAGLEGVALDDLHFADESTVALLPLLPTTGLRVVLSARRAECPAALAAWLRVASSAELLEVPLSALDASDVQALAYSLAISDSDAARLARPLVQHTGGNPLFVLETLRALIPLAGDGMNALPVSPAMELLIERRLAQLSPLALRLARVAALSGVDFGVELAAAVLERPPLDLVDAWRELEAAQMVREGSVAHVITEAVLRSIPRPTGEALDKAIRSFLDERETGSRSGTSPHWTR